MVIQCTANCGRKAALKRPKTGDALCKECFFWAFETEIHETISKSQLFKPGDVVAIGASGGKDSTVLAYVMKVLNKRYNYGLKLVLLSIDEGITGYRDDSLKTVLQNKDDYEMSLKILSYKELYGWTMDEIVAQIGRKNNCTFCGVFRRQALDRGATQLKVNCIATGHNADDIAETVLMNILRGDLARLQRCTSIVTGNDSNSIPRVKPLKYTYEKEIVLYAHYQKLKYFSTECVFAPNAYRGHARTLLKDLEKIRPSVIMDIIHSGETLHINETSKMPTLGTCKNCGYVSSQDICKACFLLEGLNRGLPKIAIGKTSKSKRLLAENKTFNESMNKPSLSGTEKYNCNKDQDFTQTDGINSNCNNCCKSNHTGPHSRDIKLCTSLVNNTQNSGKEIITMKLNKKKKYVDSLVASAIDEEIPKVKITESELNTNCIPTISSSDVVSEINVSYSDLQIENNDSDLLSKNFDNIALDTINWNKSCGKCDVCNCVTPERHKCALKIFLSSLNIVSTNHNL